MRCFALSFGCRLPFMSTLSERHDVIDNQGSATRGGDRGEARALPRELAASCAVETGSSRPSRYIDKQSVPFRYDLLIAMLLTLSPRRDRPRDYFRIALYVPTRIASGLLMLFDAPPGMF